ncbi:GDCCVxC domain-containing (seleno)protein [Roseibium sp. MMSF_3544]|uniref:GDCCVxC domain-containing (seleno)protein n=1 Tax=unclassified Roseibium TaxID=2629323 RepID=UPI00273F0AB2|nr:GDCCVxC domain-containing (seleno)protein [Roseibium sp. MMSF_3544]
MRVAPPTDRSAETPLILESVISCPECGSVTGETMPENACQWFYECRSCSAFIRPKPGDCCVFCSYGTVPCPPIQKGESCCS